MEQTITEELFANLIGKSVLQYCKTQHILDETAQQVESGALAVLAQVKEALNDETLDDPECFRRIEAIVEAFHGNGLSTSRHDWG
ncbi:MAG: hypothetical protein HDT37_10115 [Clostridiales bacterium]|nr:hypothetical protein [Clostridiales bacterium]